jgi:tetratricopeptide (TPR) repeat protein
MRSHMICLALACLAPAGCTMKQESMTMDQVLRANPSEDQFVKKDKSIRQPKPETCLEAGKMYEALYRAATEPAQQRDLSWRAKQAYAQADRLQPQWPPAISGLARVSELEGNIPAAVQYYQACLQSTNTHPGDAGCCHEAGLFFTRQKMYEQALGCMQRAMQLDPNNRTYSMNYGYALARAGRFEESHLHFTKIMSGGDASYQVALMAHHLGLADVCKRYAEQAVQADPKKTNDVQSLVASLNKPGEVQQAQATGPAGTP